MRGGRTNRTEGSTSVGEILQNGLPLDPQPVSDTLGTWVSMDWTCWCTCSVCLLCLTSVL